MSWFVSVSLIEDDKSRGWKASPLLPVPGPTCHPREQTLPNGRPVQPSGLLIQFAPSISRKWPPVETFILCIVLVTLERMDAAAAVQIGRLTKPTITRKPLVKRSAFCIMAFIS
jgi:hypothetical protein